MEKTIENWRHFVSAKRLDRGTRIGGAEFARATKVIATVDDEHLRARLSNIFNAMTKYDALNTAISPTFLGDNYPDQAVQLAEAIAGPEFDRAALINK